MRPELERLVPFLPRGAISFRVRAKSPGDVLEIRAAWDGLLADGEQLRGDVAVAAPEVAGAPYEAQSLLHERLAQMFRQMLELAWERAAGQPLGALLEAHWVQQETEAAK